MWGIGKPFYTKLKKHKSAKHTEEWGYKLGLAGILGNTKLKKHVNSNHVDIGYSSVGVDLGPPGQGPVDRVPALLEKQMGWEIGLLTRVPLLIYLQLLHWQFDQSYTCK